MGSPRFLSKRFRRSWYLLIGGLVLIVVGVSAGIWQRQKSDDAVREVAVRVARGIADGRVSDLPFADGEGAAKQQEFAQNLKSLGSQQATAQVRSIRRDGSRAVALIAVNRTVQGGVVWAYELPITLQDSESGWRIPVTQPLLHPDVQAGDEVVVRRVSPPRAEITGANDQPLVVPRPVVDVGIEPRAVTGSITAAARQVAGIVDVEVASLVGRIQAAKPDAFVDVITLRREDYIPLRVRLRAIDGVVLREREQSLAPTREFARPILGAVGPVTAEIVEANNGRYVTGDIAGTSGLQRRYDEQLAGVAGLTISTGDREIFSVPAAPGKPVRLTIDADLQSAAERALDGARVPAAFVAVDVRTGAVLAAANSPANGIDRALSGRYPPGSTFKAISTFALLNKGLNPNEEVPCPPTATVNGRSFRNYERISLGSVPFRTDFAQSCNTAFVALADRLDDDDLTEAAKQLGIGASWEIGLNAFTGSVPPASSAVDKAAASFGQARVEVSPLALTTAIAAIARGSYLPPSFVITNTEPIEPVVLPQDTVDDLRDLLRAVVVDGSGSVLKGVAGGPVYGKTGTAEFGSDSPLRTRVWFTGWQENIAFTAFVEEGDSGGKDAAPIAGRFLREVNQ
ncbi:MAG: penicillin-binding transpeptidase domain-containing protein [Actinomycetota bacterium]